jgi:hypothetical protein
MSNELQNTSIELSDDDLENVAGGTGSPTSDKHYGQVGILVKGHGTFSVSGTGNTVIGINNTTN